MRLLAPGDIRQTEALERSGPLGEGVCRGRREEAGKGRRGDAHPFAAVKQIYVNFYEGHPEKSDVEHLAEKAKKQIVNM